MSCPRDRSELLVDYCAGRLEPGAAADLARHLARCEACRDFTERQSAVWNSLDLWEPRPVSPDFDRRLYERIEAGERAPWWSRLVRPALADIRPALSLALASVIVLAALLVHPIRHAAPVPEKVRVETVDADRLERALEDVEMLRQLSVAQPDSQSL